MSDSRRKVMEKKIIKDLSTIFRNKCVMVLGDLMLDQYDTCSLTRKTMDENADIFDVKERVYYLGGAANVGQNLISLGSKVILIGVVGQDHEASVFKNLIRKAKLPTGGIVEDRCRPTTTKTRIIKGSELLFRIDREVKREIDGVTLRRTEELIAEGCAKSDGCVISDYAKGVVTERVCQFAISTFKKARKPVFIDPKGNNYKKYKGATIITPNRKELDLVSGKHLGYNMNRIVTAAEKLRVETKLESILVTVGSRGMVMINENGYLHSPAFKVNKINASGAGDTAISVVSLGYITEMKEVEMLRLANYCCSRVIQEKGTAVVSY